MTELEECLQRENAALRHGVPLELLSGVPADQVEAHARQLVQWRGQQAPATAPGAGAPVPGAPVPSSNAVTSAESAEDRELREMRHKVRWRGGRTGGPRTMVAPWEAEQFMETAFRVSWNAHMEHRRTGRGNVSEPPRGVPAAAAGLAPMGASF